METITFEHEDPELSVTVYLYKNLKTMRKGISRKDPDSLKGEFRRSIIACAVIDQIGNKKGPDNGNGYWTRLYFCEDHFTPGIISHEVQHVSFYLLQSNKNHARFNIKIRGLIHEEKICGKLESLVDYIWDNLKPKG